MVADARELPRVALDDALRICLVLRDGDTDRYQRAAVRWLGRLALEARDLTIEDLRLAAEALDPLRDRTTEAMERLQGLCVSNGASRWSSPCDHAFRVMRGHPSRRHS